MTQDDALTKWLDEYFSRYPSEKTVYLANLPEFNEDVCFVLDRAPRRISFSMAHDGLKRRIIGERALIRYLVKGTADIVMPLTSCDKGCVNPHHQHATRPPEGSKFVSSQRKTLGPFFVKGQIAPPAVTAE